MLLGASDKTADDESAINTIPGEICLLNPSSTVCVQKASINVGACQVIASNFDSKYVEPVARHERAAARRARKEKTIVPENCATHENTLVRQKN